MFERFTAPARRAVVLAQEEARQLGHQRIGTEHLLLGLIAQGSWIAARVLRTRGPPGVRLSRHAGWRPKGHLVLELSVAETVGARRRFAMAERKSTKKTAQKSAKSATATS